jgi:hypothetical protein
VGVELRGGGREAWPAGQREKGREKREKRRDAFASCSVCACVFVLCGGARLWSDRIRRAPDATDGQGRTRKRGTYGTCRPAGGGRLRLDCRRSWAGLQLRLSAAFADPFGAAVCGRD